MIPTLEWNRDPMLDTMVAVASHGTYKLVRTYSDASKLYYNGHLLDSDTGTHQRMMARALEHHALQLKRLSPVLTEAKAKAQTLARRARNRRA